MSQEMEYDDNGDDGPIDEKLAKADIVAGARALKNLQKSAGHNWMQGWSIAIRGWRGLRDLAFKRAGVRDQKSQAYRDAMTGLLNLAPNYDYKAIPKATRAAMTRLMDHVQEVDDWYATLPTWDRERWTNPQTIIKHCPSEFLVGRSHNQPKRNAKGPKKKGNPEAESLRAVLIRIIIKYVQPVDPDEAKALLENLYAYQSDPDDGLDDLEIGDEETADAE